MILQRHGGRFLASKPAASRWYSSTPRWQPLKESQDGRVETFREQAFVPCKAVLLPRGHFLRLPAAQKWFTSSRGDTTGASLNHDYLSKFGDAVVPLEFTKGEGEFQRAEAPLHIFLEWNKFATTKTPDRLYLAQASFASLPQEMIEDLPTPEIVAKAGAGDIYDTNIWMGIPPTYTPLHRDPNPNLFVQLVGHKVVRMVAPEAGNHVFARVQQALGKSKPAAFRGDEMMKGQEKKLLEAEVWGDGEQAEHGRATGYEVHLAGGDGLFIPKGWWHSVKGIGEGVTGSVNWWFIPSFRSQRI
jgi:hypothetical protein